MLKRDKAHQLIPKHNTFHSGDRESEIERRDCFWMKKSLAVDRSYQNELTHLEENVSGEVDCDSAWTKVAASSALCELD